MAALQGLHPFTDCDDTAAFYKKGKYNTMQWSNKMLQGSTSKRSKISQNTDHPDVETLSSFVCITYGQKHMADVNEARHAGFQRTSGRIAQDHPLVH